MKTLQRLLSYVRIGAQVVLTIVDVVDGFLNPKEPAVAPSAILPDDDDFKPERIQFWLEVIGEACLAVAAVIGKEARKPRGSASDAAETVEE